jgi:ABC-2 type transport system ATP-binding protein
MIKVDQLFKSFSGKTVLHGISFDVGAGEVLGFLGPNGAGKSTTMRIITGFLEPDSGEVSICGHDISSEPVLAKQRIGYLAESAASYQDMKVSDFLNFTADIRALHGSQKTAAIERVIELCHLGPVLNQSIENLSKGFRQRVGLAQALVHDPDVLILDEPTDGLDPNQKHEIRSLITSLGQSKAIIFSTHILEEVESVCTRAIVVHEGLIVANGTPLELKSRTPSGRLDDFFRAITQGAVPRQADLGAHA